MKGGRGRNFHNFRAAPRRPDREPRRRQPRSPHMKHRLAATTLALAIAACTPAPADAPANDAIANDMMPTAPPTATPSPTPTATADPQILTLEGLGPLKIGQPVPVDSGFAERGAQASDTCRTVSSPDYPGVYAIVADGAVRRITAGKNATVRLVEGIGVGASEEQVMAAFAGFTSTPHKYVEPPAKYLTAPNAPGGDPALRFEIGRDGKVSLIHIGTMPVLAYVEGCA